MNAPKRMIGNIIISIQKVILKAKEIKDIALTVETAIE
jgi:hypothetical protein